MLSKAFSPNLLAKVKSRAQYQNIVGASDTGISGCEVCRVFGCLRAGRMFAFRHNDRKRGAVRRIEAALRSKNQNTAVLGIGNRRRRLFGP
jgi:hypothetical protein